MKKILNKFNLLEWGMILSVIGFTLYFSLINTTSSLFYIIIDAIAAICGIFCVVLCAKGKKSQYIWGVFNILGYVIIAFINKYYGEVMLNALYYLPSQFLGYYFWQRHENKETNDVIGKCLTSKQTILSLIGCLILIITYKFLLDGLGGNQTLLDSASTIISVVANILMLARFREQWLLWIIIDIITVIMWALAKDYVMVVMWSVYLINAFYGYYKWTKLEKRNV